MKKFLVFAVIVGLLMPAAAFAATEFSLGGYIKLDTFWDSTQSNSLLYLPMARNNSVADNHGRFNMRAQESRFNFTIKGPKLWGATTTGFIEMDFDGTTDSATTSTSGTWQARLRHAMFRLNWPETELLMGQYWGFFSNWWTEAAEDGPFIMMGSALDRIPQIRVTQKFLGDWSVAGLMGLPYNVNLTTADPYGGSGGNGASSETPQFQGMVTYAHDWWGKAAYYGTPKPFTATVSAGWERNINRVAVNSINTLQATGAGSGYVNFAGQDINQKYVNPWMLQGALFIPVIPTHSANLAGTASILTQWYIGQGVEVFGITGNSSNLYKLQADGTWTPSLMNRFGGWVEAQYYFTNQWYLNAAYGITRNFGFTRTTTVGLLGTADNFRSQQQVDATLWYRPIQALKFGLQYTYAHADYFQITDTGAVGGTPDISNKGDEHRVEFVGIFYF
jgi:hypothetical protein